MVFRPHMCVLWQFKWTIHPQTSEGTEEQGPQNFQATAQYIEKWLNYSIVGTPGLWAT